jgi:hypothetical protein
MKTTTQALLERWTKARDARDIAQRRVCFAASLYVKGTSVSLDDLKGYVDQADAADAAADACEREYRESYAPKGGA